MKQLTLILSVFMASFSFAQTTLIIDGHITDSNNTAISNHAVYIDTLRANVVGPPTFIYQNIVYTDVNGYYADTVNIPATNPFGGLSIYTINCQGDTLWAMAVWQSSGAMTTTNDFNYCPSQGSSGTNNYEISGSVSFLNTPAGDARVYLITYDSSTTILAAADSMDVSASGKFYFDSLAAGRPYLLKAALLPSNPDYANYLPTYYDKVLFWNIATAVYPAPAAFYNIDMVGGINPGGPGFIGGLVSQGANKTTGPGDPYTNASVLLLDVNDNAIAYDITDQNGEYAFSNIAYGTYKVYVEVLGKYATPAIVTIDPNTPSSDGVNFKVNSTTITTAVKDVTVNHYDFRVGPNPAGNELIVQVGLFNAISVEVQLYDVSGKVVLGGVRNLDAGDNQWTIDLNEIPAGQYMLTLESGGKAIYDATIIRTR